jgi:hypothetical protein
MIRIIMRLLVNGQIDIAFARKKQERCQIQDCWRGQDKQEQEKRPGLLISPAVEDPLGNDQIEEKIDDPYGVHPINPSM